MAKAALSTKTILFTSTLDLNLREKLVKRYIRVRSIAFYVAEREHFGKQITNTWKAFKCRVGGGWRRSVGPIVRN
jgi:hypothetical protein